MPEQHWLGCEIKIMTFRFQIHRLNNGFPQWLVVQWMGTEYAAKVNRMLLP
jgi:hypothetical protein